MTPPLLLAVTALTSLSAADVASVGSAARSRAGWTLAALAHGAGIRGLVASSRELPMLRARFGPEMRLVIPGIRPRAPRRGPGADRDSREAIRAGASFIVVGRPILKSADPAQAADDIVAEMAAGMAPE